MAVPHRSGNRVLLLLPLKERRAMALNLMIGVLYGALGMVAIMVYSLTLGLYVTGIIRNEWIWSLVSYYGAKNLWLLSIVSAAVFFILNITLMTIFLCNPSHPRAKALLISAFISFGLFLFYVLLCAEFNRYL